MTDEVKLFLDNVTFMSARLSKRAEEFKALVSIMNRYPIDVFSLISNKDKALLLSSFLDVDKALDKVRGDEIEKLLKRLNTTIHGGHIDFLRDKIK